ncbi:MAG: zinc ABC transporter substrate-binding protein [Bacteroidales bacterium]|nr:zinc ABC transporter substrate-binding protein [Bacteroidales bacterium]
MSRINSAIIFSLLLFALSACSENAGKNEQKTISVSILPQKYFINALTCDTFSINVMVPSGASPASYEPTPKQMTALDNSGLYLRIGHIGFEKAWMDKMSRNHPDMKVVDVSKGISLIGSPENHENQPNKQHSEGDHNHQGIDPHIWLSPRATKIIVQNTASALINYDNSLQNVIMHKKDSLLQVIDNLDNDFTQLCAGLTNRKFLIFHPALTYLARDYGLEQISMEIDGKLPSVAHFKNIVDRVKAENIRIIFIQKEFNTENANQMAIETGAKIIQIDPLNENWLEQMRKIMNKIKTLDN